MSFWATVVLTVNKLILHARAHVRTYKIIKLYKHVRTYVYVSAGHEERYLEFYFIFFRLNR